MSPRSIAPAASAHEPIENDAATTPVQHPSVHFHIAQMVLQMPPPAPAPVAPTAPAAVAPRSHMCSKATGCAWICVAIGMLVVGGGAAMVWTAAAGVAPTSASPALVTGGVACIGGGFALLTSGINTLNSRAPLIC